MDLRGHCDGLIDARQHLTPVSILCCLDWHGLQEIIHKWLRCLQQPLIACQVDVCSMPLEQVAPNVFQVSLQQLNSLGCVWCL